MHIILEDKISKDIENYCKLNNLGSVTQYVNKLIKKAFMLEKYGDKPGRNDNFNAFHEVKEEKENKKNEIITIKTNINETKPINDSVDVVEEIKRKFNEESKEYFNNINKKIVQEEIDKGNLKIIEKTEEKKLPIQIVDLREEDKIEKKPRKRKLN